MTTTFRDTIKLDDGELVNCRIIGDSFIIHADLYPLKCVVTATSGQMGFGFEKTWRYHDNLQDDRCVAFFETIQHVRDYMEFRIRKYYKVKEYNESIGSDNV